MKINRILAYRVELPLQETTYKWSGGKSVTVFDSTIVGIETVGGNTDHAFILDENIDSLDMLLQAKSDLAMDVVNLKRACKPSKLLARCFAVLVILRLFFSTQAVTGASTAT